MPVSRRDTLPAVRFARVRDEKALAEARLPEPGDQRLRLGCDEEVRQRPRAGEVRARRVPGVELEHVVDVVQQGIALDHGHELQLVPMVEGDRKSTRLNSSHGYISYAVFCLKKKKHESSLARCILLPSALHPALAAHSSHRT